VSRTSSKARRPLTLHAPAGIAVLMRFSKDCSVLMRDLGISRIVSPAFETTRQSMCK
jgi:hypothetical protein